MLLKCPMDGCRECKSVALREARVIPLAQCMSVGPITCPDELGSHGRRIARKRPRLLDGIATTWTMVRDEPKHATVCWDAPKTVGLKKVDD